jgi:phytoene dehydrogenase-like protein
MKNKVLILGGGIAGLSTGVYLQKQGIPSAIYEKNPVLGGECVSWRREGYVIDNCIHWLTGSKKGDTLNAVWRDVGAIDDSTAFINEPYFYRLRFKDVTLSFWCDREKARKEFLACAPEDSQEINAFFDAVKRAECVQVPTEKSLAKMGFIEYMKTGMSMRAMLPVLKAYSHISIAQLAAKFKNPHMQQMIRGYFNDDYQALILITSCAFYTSGTAALPIGGSQGVIERMKAKYLSLGGEVHLARPAASINLEKNRAVSVRLSSGEVVACPAVVAACDPEVTFGTLLSSKFREHQLAKMRSHQKEDYLVASCVGITYGIEGSEDYGFEPGSVSFPCEPFQVGTKPFDLLDVRLYDADPTLYPQDKRVVRVIILQGSADYAYWEQLYSHQEAYQKEKQRIAEAVLSRIETQYPLARGHLKCIDAYTPVTFNRYCGAYQGSYMAFFQRYRGKTRNPKNTVRHLSNVFLASQWLSSTGGGLPMAVTSGKFAADEVAHYLKKSH